MKRHILLALLIVFIICIFAVGATYTIFSNQTKSEGNSFTVGTLKLGGIFGEASVAEQFAHLSLSDAKPGQTTLLGPVKLKNLGNLPFKLYRITSSNFQDAVNLGEKLSVKVKIGEEPVYQGKLSQLVESNGGYFDTIDNIPAGSVRDLNMEVSMDEDAGNEYQNKAVTCDFNIFATQNEVPSNGENGMTVRLGPAKDEYGNVGENTFYVNVKNTNDSVVFDWDWQPSDDKSWGAFEYYILEIKHETGNPTTDFETGSFKMKFDPIDEKTQTLESINGITTNDISVNWANDEIKIRKDAFPADWKGFEVKISGIQKFGGNIVSIPYQYWSLDR